MESAASQESPWLSAELLLHRDSRDLAGLSADDTPHLHEHRDGSPRGHSVGNLDVDLPFPDLTGRKTGVHDVIRRNLRSADEHSRLQLGLDSVGRLAIG